VQACRAGNEAIQITICGAAVFANALIQLEEFEESEMSALPARLGRTAEIRHAEIGYKQY